MGEESERMIELIKEIYEEDLTYGEELANKLIFGLHTIKELKEGEKQNE